MGYVEYSPAKVVVRTIICDKKLSFLKEVAIFTIISFKIGFIGIVKY